MLFVVASIAFSTITPAYNNKTGRDLVHLCETVNDKQSTAYIAQGYCIGYVEGVSTMLDQQTYEDRKLNRDLSFDICEPQGVTNEERIKILLRYADQSPEILHEPSAGLVLVALRDAFPCRVSSTP